MNSKFILSGAKKKLFVNLEENYGLGKLPYMLIETGREKIRGFSGTMNKEELMGLAEIANVEIVGMYLLKSDGSYRFSFDATQILGEQIKKNVVEINSQQMQDWMSGKDVEIGIIEKGIVVVKHGEDYLGCGISDGKRIINHVPKERRIRR